MDAVILAQRTELNAETNSDRLVALGGRAFVPEVLEAPPRVRLAHFAKEAVLGSLIQPRAPQFHSQGDGPHSSRDLLGLLTFSYGTGVMTVERIYGLLDSDILFQSFLHGPKPHPGTVRAFRRVERAALVSSLSRFFEMSFEVLRESSSDQTTRTSWTRALALSNPLPSVDSTATAELVQDRINQATWVDRMLMDF
jgi:hypothetical protein